LTHTTVPTPLQGRFAAARDGLYASLVDREAEVDLALAALLSGESLLLVSATPGLGKSMLARHVAGLLRGGEFFSRLLTKFTGEAEVFGPLNVAALAEGRYVRHTERTLVTAHVAFLDEVFKASSAILNSLLQVLNERTYCDGTTEAAVPLLSFFGASNEYPGSDGQGNGQELSAFLDRFLIRKDVRPIGAHGDERRLILGPGGDAAYRADATLLAPDALPAPPAGVFDVAEILQARAEAARLPVTRAAADALFEVLAELKADGVFPGDRRKKKSVDVLRAYAYLCQADRVEPDHLEVLAHVLWVDPKEQPATVARVLGRVVATDGAKAVELLQEARGVVDGLKGRDTIKVAEAMEKLRDVEKRLGTLKAGPRVVRVKATVASQRKELGAVLAR
jgi:MoxR-like ATPase